MIERLHDKELKKYFYVKGSPEAIGKLVIPSSLPSDYDKLLTKYTRLVVIRAINPS